MLIPVSTGLCAQLSDLSYRLEVRALTQRVISSPSVKDTNSSRRRVLRVRLRRQSRLPRSSTTVRARRSRYSECMHRVTMAAATSPPNRQCCPIERDVEENSACVCRERAFDGRSKERAFCCGQAKRRPFSSVFKTHADRKFVKAKRILVKRFEESPYVLIVVEYSERDCTSRQQWYAH